MLNFGVALEFLKNGKKIARQGWNGKGMWVSLFSSLLLGIDNGNSIDFNFDDEELGESRFKHWHHFEGDNKCKIKDCICMFTAGKEIQLGWLASQADILAEDWVVLN